MNPTMTVYRKEMRELLRDKRVRTSAIIMPALLVYAILQLFGFMSGIGDKENQKIHVVMADNSLVRRLKDQKVKIIEIASREAGEKLIRDGKANVVLEFEPDYDAKVKAGQPTQIQAYFDPQVTPAKIALATLQGDLMEVNKDIAERVLKAKRVDPKSLAPASVTENPVKVGKDDVSELLLTMLPYFIVIWAFYGGMATAGDIVAGEKEKQTLETLLITPVGRSQIAFGKFFALASICFVSSFSALMGFVITGLMGKSKLFPQGLGIGVSELATIVLVLIPTVAFFASLLIAISTYAKNAREAQSYLSLVSFVVIMPAIFGQVIGFTDLASNWWIRLIPVLNTSVSVREAIQGKTNGAGVALTVAVGVVLALIGIRIAVHLFKREEVLTRV